MAVICHYTETMSYSSKTSHEICRNTAWPNQIYFVAVTGFIIALNVWSSIGFCQHNAHL